MGGSQSKDDESQYSSDSEANDQSIMREVETKEKMREYEKEMKEYKENLGFVVEIGKALVFIVGAYIGDKIFTAIIKAK